MPRIPGVEWSAPVYDGLTAPSDFPRVSACFFSQRKGCECFSQQATPVKVPESACLVFVADGSFDPWLSKRMSETQQAPAASKVEPSQPISPAAPVAPTQSLVVVEDHSRFAKK